MTTFDPGASVVLTHGLADSPFSTAALASRPAPTMTYGLEVLVQLVIAAMATAPWSSSTRSPLARVVVTGLLARSRHVADVDAGAAVLGLARSTWTTGSQAGKDSSLDSSRPASVVGRGGRGDAGLAVLLDRDGPA